MATVWHRQLVLELLELCRASVLHRPILRLLVWFHNTSYHLIAFFAATKGKHPKHDIQQYHRFFLEHVSDHSTVLDIGSGWGEVAYDLAQKAQRVIAIDIEPANIAAAQARYRHPNLTYMVGDATTFPFSEKFDVIVLSNVLEHIKDRVSFLQRLQTLSPLLLIRVPMITRDWITVFKKNEGFEYRLDDTHFIEYDIPTFEREIAAAGLVISTLKVDFGELYAVVRAN